MLQKLFVTIWQIRVVLRDRSLMIGLEKLPISVASEPTRKLFVHCSRAISVIYGNDNVLDERLLAHHRRLDISLGAGKMPAAEIPPRRLRQPSIELLELIFCLLLECIEHTSAPQHQHVSNYWAWADRLEVG